MDLYLESIRKSAIGILDNSKTFDGGLFAFIADNDILDTLLAPTNTSVVSITTNASADQTPKPNIMSLFVKDAKSSIFSGGLLLALIFTILLTLLMLVLCVYTCIRRNKSFSTAGKFMLNTKVKRRAENLQNQFEFPLKLLLTFFLFSIFILAFAPLILSFASSSKLHQNLKSSQTEGARNSSDVKQPLWSSSSENVELIINNLFNQLDSFLVNLVPEAKVEIQPVLDRTLQMTNEMKVKSQKAYQDAFKLHIGALPLIAASTDLIDRISLFYYDGIRYTNMSSKVRFEGFKMKADYQDFKKDHPTKCESDLGIQICDKHYSVFNLTMHQIVTFLGEVQAKNLDNQIELIADELRRLPNTLPAVNKTPDRMLEQKTEKEKISEEFNRNISSVFDRELNSTAFVLEMVEKKLDDLDVKLSGVRERMGGRRQSVMMKYKTASKKYEGLRFAVTIVVLLILLGILVTTTVFLILYLINPSFFNIRRNNNILLFISLSYFIYGLTFLFIYSQFAVTGYLHTELCRYLLEKPVSTTDATHKTSSINRKLIIDEKLLPKINNIILKMKLEAAMDPNKTDAIPVNKLELLYTGLVKNCPKNQPILAALQSTEHIDTKAGADPNASLNFKLKGLQILISEMNRANLSVLRDEGMAKQMDQFKVMVESFNTAKFGQLGADLNSLKNLTNSLRISSQEILSLNKNISSMINSNKSFNLFSYPNNNNLKIGSENLIKSELVYSFMDNFVDVLTQMETKKNLKLLIDNVVTYAIKMDGFLKNQTLWTLTAADYYKQYVVEGSKEESEEISDYSGKGILSSVAKCQLLSSMVESAVNVPCKVILYPLSILWFTMGWSLFFLMTLTIILHIFLSNVCFITDPTSLRTAKDIELSSTTGQNTTNGVHALPNSKGDENTLPEAEVLLSTSSHVTA